MRTIPALLAGVALLVAAAGCGTAPGARGRKTVVAAFYPLAFAAERAGGTTADVKNLTPPGTEPHDIELTPREVAEVQEADVVLYLTHGFQPAVEQAVAGATGKRLDVLSGIGLRRGVGDEAGKSDPHVWLDPVLMSQLVGEVERGLAAADPKGAATYQKNTQALQDQLAALDARYRERLTGCARTLLVTSHEAFGYLATRYGLHQQGVAGLSPDQEPDPARLGELAQLARDQGVTTVFTEETVSPRIAQTLARDAGGLRTEVLSPLESLSKKERADKADYFSLMDANLEKLATALGCAPRS